MSHYSSLELKCPLLSPQISDYLPQAPGTTPPSCIQIVMIQWNTETHSFTEWTPIPWLRVVCWFSEGSFPPVFIMLRAPPLSLCRSHKLKNWVEILRFPRIKHTELFQLCHHDKRVIAVRTVPSNTSASVWSPPSHAGDATKTYSSRTRKGSWCVTTDLGQVEWFSTHRLAAVKRRQRDCRQTFCIPRSLGETEKGRTEADHASRSWDTGSYSQVLNFHGMHTLLASMTSSFFTRFA